MAKHSQQSNPQEQTLTMKEAELMAQEIADKIAARFENSDPAARERLFSQCLLVLMSMFHVIPD